MSIKEKIRRYRPERPAREPDPPHIRDRLQVKIKLWDEWKANGKYTVKNPDGSWRYTAADLTAEAEERMAR